MDSDITEFDLTLPEKQFTLDAQQWDLSTADSFMATSCAAMPGACALAAQQFCDEGECFGSCSQTTQTCDLTLLVSLWRTIDLVTEKPELESIDNQPIIDVSIDRITYRVSENTLNVDTPEFTIYVAPATVMDPSDPQALEIGTIPPIPAGTTVPAGTAVVLTGGGRAALATQMSDFRTPFNILVGATLEVTASSTLPAGLATALVSVEAHAGL